MRLSASVFLLSSLLVAQTSLDREAKWREDIRNAEEAILKTHPDPFTRIAKNDWQVSLDALRGSLAERSDFQVAAELARVVASIGDAHTTISLAQGGLSQRLYPLRVRWFPDGLFVVDAADALGHLLAGEVTGIGDKSAEEAFTLVRRYISHENESWARLQSEFYLISAEILHASGVIAAPGSAVFTIRTTDGNATRTSINPVTTTMVSAPLLSSPKFPLYRRNPRQIYWFSYLAESRTLYIQYNACRETRALPMARFAEDMLAAMAAQPVERLVMDLRANGGGDSGVIYPLLEALGGGLARGVFRLTSGAYVLIGAGTFSSGTLNATDLKSGGAVLVGAPTGGGASVFGNTTFVRLEHSGLLLFISKQRFDVPGFPGTTVVPDIAVELRSADFFADKDPVLERALELNLPFQPPAGQLLKPPDVARLGAGVY
jgi:hypothetical protein